MTRQRTRRPTPAPSAPSAPAPPDALPDPRGLRLLRGALSLVVPGLGQLAARRVVAAGLCLVGALLPYFFFLVLVNDRYGVRGELLSFSFGDLSGRGVPFRPPAEHWALLLVGVAVHAAAVWDAARRRLVE